MSDEKRKLGVIAGGGSLPRLLVEYLRQNQSPFEVLAISGNADEQSLKQICTVKTVRLGEAGTGFKYFKEKNVQDVIMIGTIRRPSLSDLVPDIRTAAFFAKIGLKALGDDGLLRALIKEIEHEGFRVLGIHEVLPDILLSEGILTRKKPDKQALSDIKRGLEVATTLGKLDVGQSVVVQQGLVLGVEGIEGTDELIKRCGTYKRKGDGGVLVKIRKPEQDMRVDLPTIGVTTIENAHQAGLKGLAVHAGNALVVNQKEVVRLANLYKMFLIGVNPAEYL
ncbi:MAG: UDP-2,3-diacylglucosamine diphosphatase LpxI [Alphaproteobacteria bacterium]|nr:UDP-2,3-diacylglucosamine diphosphatase LpxI [Alphaproteobacteria bacterium]